MDTLLPVLTDSWRTAFPGEVVGVLAMHNLANPPSPPGINEHVQKVEAAIRSRFAGMQRADVASLPRLEAHRRHYGPFDKTYHLRLQLESLLFKRKSLRSADALVEAMFVAEVSNLLLTAGHDLDSIAANVKLISHVAATDGP